MAQPVSMGVNLALVVAATYARTTPVRVTLAFYALFEAWHTWSHTRHQSGRVQKRVVHALGLLMAFATLWMIQSVMPWLLCGLVLFLALFVNEDWNCWRMQEAHTFPYHAVMFTALALMWLECAAR